MRRALVNDLVHSFCFACRASTKQQGIAWPAVILEQKLPAIAAPHSEFDSVYLVYPAAYAFANQPNYILATRIIILYASWFRTLSIDERNYTLQLFKDYYGFNIHSGQAQ